MPATVSILVPSYNHAPFVGACLRSVVAQSFSDWSLTLIDDCSPDQSLEAARAVPDARINVLSNDRNLGTYATLQRGLELDDDAPYVAILNSDDFWEPQKLRLQIEMLERFPEARFCYTLGRQVDAQGQTLEADQHQEWPTTEIQELLPYLLRENRLLASSIVFRRDGLRFHTECRYSGDWIALLEQAVKGPAACVPEPLTAWRMHANNAHRRSPNQLEEEIWVREGIHSRKWSRPGVPAKQIRQGLSLNQMHLAALYVLAGSIGAARIAALQGLAMRPGVDTAKRVAATHLPTGVAKKKLWPNEANRPDSVEKKPLEWLD